MISANSKDDLQTGEKTLGIRNFICRIKFNRYFSQRESYEIFFSDKYNRCTERYLARILHAKFRTEIKRKKK